MDLGVGAPLMPANVDALVARWRANGYLDAFVLRPGGAAEIVNLYDLNEVAESFPSFTGRLERMVR